MAATHYTGPLIITSVDNSGNEFNPTPGMSMFKHGVGMFDGRNSPAFGADISRPYYGWYGTTRIPIINQAPSVIPGATNNIAASAVPVANTPIALVTTSGAGITVGASVRNALTGALVTGLLAIDGAFGTTSLGQYNGQSLNVSMYDPSTAVSRCVSIVSAGNDSTGTFTVAGFDIYGFPLTATVTGASGAPGTATTLKAFKYIQSVTPAGTLSGSAVTVGTSNTYGLPLACDYFAQAELYFNNALLTTGTTTFTAADRTNPATALTGDTRGTFTATADGTKVIQAFGTPLPFTVSTTGTVITTSGLSDIGLFGVQQV